jgi:hypothetical protein
MSAPTPKFLPAVDQDTMQLYILHRQFPAFLAHVVQTIPHTIKIIDLYDQIKPEELEKHPCMNELKTWIKNYFQKNMGGN